ncbi:HPr family phosphocarrier protein [Parvibaculum sedimenti]|uniref:HPr family phosphocarrier protein n=1 Tax=Parvibaculum sedimenti TaxID=2608632 RepID=A0A6N6VPB8_9HYPH|nr:HPr family phosphocarrier protein [Parvibaculum sedimenti]KAB7742685.1 HPr family phosphocarrier protein [Parvibaculum sedimenti]
MPADAEAEASRPESRLLNIVNTRGLHARASAKFVQCAEKFDAEVKVSKEGNSVSGTSIMGLMMLAAGPGCCILIEAEGPEAKAALDALEALVSDGFGERD